MSRQIITRGTGISIATSNTQPPDTYVSKILKLIPADIVSVYLTVFNLIKSHAGNAPSKEVIRDTQTLQWIAFGVMTVIVPIYLRKVAGIISFSQILLCLVSFLLWVMTVGGPLDGVTFGGNYTVQFFGALILPFFTLFAPKAYTPPS